MKTTYVLKAILRRMLRPWFSFSPQGTVTRKKLTFTPYIECLEAKIAPANYYWNPPNVPANSNVSNVANWGDVNGNNTFANAPGQTDQLIFRGDNTRDCVFDVNASYASIEFRPAYTGAVTLSANIFFFGVDEGNQANRPSLFDNARITGTINVGQKATMTFNGSPLQIKSSRLLDNISVINGVGNPTTITTGTSYWRTSEFLNKGTMNWTDANIMNFDGGTIWNFADATLTISNGATLGRANPAGVLRSGFKTSLDPVF
jgi:hypothetical protein